MKRSLKGYEANGMLQMSFFLDSFCSDKKAGNAVHEKNLQLGWKTQKKTKEKGQKPSVLIKCAFQKCIFIHKNKFWIFLLFTHIRHFETAEI